ncbi:probable ribosome production factor 1 [Cimex lectularius]|uniref:Brix domain-containing protein n=1 Tax=Cimex lectularius TaxID=79782 RepID=A0A8I6RC29_CIMLE|nr:probable ribosome production factor 1 [Cimex lectularius]XP_014243305.1 probable ribosome production factor 1 [Cimex lectularius]
MGKIKRDDEENENRRSINDIKNKIVRRTLAGKELIKKKKMKKEERKRRREAGEAPQKPHTIESLRVPDETILDPTKAENVERIEETAVDINTDDFQSYFSMEYVPKVLITFADNPLQKTRIFGVELCRIIPNSMFRYRGRSSVKKIVKRAIEKKFSDVIIVNENMKEPNGLLIIHLPNGPTAFFRMSNVKLTSDLKKSHKDINSYRPEVILNNFTTRLGSSVARMLASLFHYDPEFKGKRAVTFHNQRDYIFFRHHRYDFSSKAKPMLKELGPRFTLRLEYIQEGTFDTKLGIYEWVKSGNRHSLEANRRKFQL